MKYRISVIDGILLNGKINSGKKDVDGKELFLGDAVQRQGQRLLIAWRYDQFVLKALFSGSYINLSDNSGVTKLNEVVAAPDEWIAIGYVTDIVFPQVKHMFADPLPKEATMLEVI